MAKKKVKKPRSERNKLTRKPLSQQRAEAKAKKKEQMTGTGAKLIGEASGVLQLARMVFNDMIKNYKTMRQQATAAGVYDEFMEAAKPVQDSIVGLQNFMKDLAKKIQVMQKSHKKNQKIEQVMASSQQVSNMGNAASLNLKKLSNKLAELKGEEPEEIEEELLQANAQNIDLSTLPPLPDGTRITDRMGPPPDGMPVPPKDPMEMPLPEDEEKAGDGPSVIMDHANQIEIAVQESDIDTAIKETEFARGEQPSAVTYDDSPFKKAVELDASEGAENAG